MRCFSIGDGRVDTIRSRQIGGFGLKRQAIASQIVQGYGGQITVKTIFIPIQLMIVTHPWVKTR
ncbi:sensor histidine kinase [Nostoc sphaeroides CCNUC1]|uniref:Sensor histidine kinase n=1 Tax=Nostoc sphaeroides CCNUC1 TaxID=2653204 RepID=A0A5P8W9I7_9NOSO|nr:sensor histidine kinase [Nostoc sphaeroides CCNUC1]